MYYRLTYISSDQKEKVGDYVLNGIRPLHIGQDDACDVRLPESDKYEPQLFATILARESGVEWYVVRRTDCFDIQVNGVDVSIAQVLKNKDVLTLSDGTITTELRFDIIDDGEYDANSGIVYQKHKGQKGTFAITTLLALLAIGVVAYSLFNRQKDLRHSDLSLYSSSVYHITADSVYLLCDSLISGERQQVIVEAIELSQVAAGTCFLTEDSLFVTARHCIEPWINDEEWDGVSSKHKMSPEVRLATMAETGNRMAGYDKYILRAHCVISKGLDRYDYYSTDFKMNKTRDMVMRLGTAKEVFYWRTIFPIAHRRDMELGDFAYLKAKDISEKGTIPMATWEDLQVFASPGNDHDIAVVGYPLNDNDADDVAVPVYGNLMSMELNDAGKGLTGCMQLSAPINRGNSGGPVFAMIDGTIKVVGIVSKADGRANQGMFWAVPVTEVVNMRQHGDQIEQDTVTFRR